MRLGKVRNNMHVAPTTTRRMDNAEATRASDEMIAPLPKIEHGTAQMSCSLPEPANQLGNVMRSTPRFEWDGTRARICF